MSSGNVIVVGAGHIGLACAHYLRQDGYDVRVIDQGKIGSACSRANCGFVVPSHIAPLTTPSTLRKGLASLFNPRAPFRIQLQMRWALYEWLFQFARRCTHRKSLQTARVLHELLEASATEYRELFRDPGLDCDPRQDGLLFVFQGESALQEFVKDEESLAQAFGLDLRHLNPSEVADLEPALSGEIAGAFLYPNDASLQPDKLNTDWAKRLVASGVEFTENCELERVSRTNNRVTEIETSEGPISADRYVFAMGAWSTQFSNTIGCKIPIEPGKGYSVTLDAPPSSPRYPMLFPEAHIGVTPFQDSMRIGSMMEFVGFDRSLPAYRIEQLIRSARPYLDLPEDPSISDTWYGWRPMTWDGLPIIGRVPGVSNALLASGHNMLGLSLAPVTGKLVADIVSERRIELPIEALSPLRFA